MRCERYQNNISRIFQGQLYHLNILEKLITACSFGWWMMAGLFGEKSVGGWLLVAGLF
jgi:hypothetical protein